MRGTPLPSLAINSLMFRRIVFSAGMAGLLVGLFLTILQSFQVIPLILKAEAYEIGEAALYYHNPALADPRPEGGWVPQDGWQRTLFTALANILIAMGFALLLGALFSLRPGIDGLKGMAWGLTGYGVFFILPSLGLPPEIPGTWAAELGERQAWWWLTVSCSATGLALLILQRRWSLRITGAGLLLLPHLLSAPQPEVVGGSAPEALADVFIWATAIVNGVFWIALGGLTGFLFKRLA
jgi:cobalt transporter subunit CbtA (proposed)